MAEWLNPYQNLTEDYAQLDTSYEDDGTANILSLTSKIKLQFSTWLESQEGIDTPACGRLLLLPYDGFRLSVKLSQIETLAKLWKIPRPVLAAPLMSRQSLDCILPTTFRDPVGITWHVHSLQLPVESPLARHRNQGSHITVSYSTYDNSTTEARDCSVHNAIVYCPATMINQVETMILECQDSDLFTKDNHQALLRFILLLLGNIITFQWAVAELVSGETASAAIKSLMDAGDGLLSAQDLSRIEIALRHSRSYLSSLNNLVVSLQELKKSALQHFGHNWLLLDAFSDYKQQFESIADVFQGTKVELESMKRMFSDIVQSNNAKYLRTNTIEMRRLAERSQKESSVVQNLARQSAEDSREMKRLAYLTMAFLPTTTVAAVFSTPFFDLENSQTFNALSKAWLLLVPSLILTAVTFSASYAWDIWRKSTSVALDLEGTIPTNNINLTALEPRVDAPRDIRTVLLESILRQRGGSTVNIDEPPREGLPQEIQQLLDQLKEPAEVEIVDGDGSKPEA